MFNITYPTFHLIWVTKNLLFIRNITISLWKRREKSNDFEMSYIIHLTYKNNVFGQINLHFFLWHNQMKSCSVKSLQNDNTTFNRHWATPTTEPGPHVTFNKRLRYITHACTDQLWQGITVKIKHIFKRKLSFLWCNKIICHTKVHHNLLCKVWNTNSVW